MGKFCTSCGSPLADNARFCPYCGARLATNVMPGALVDSASTTSASREAPLDVLKEKTVSTVGGFKNSSRRNTYIGIAAFAVVAIVLIVILVNLFGGGYMGALNDYFEAIEDRDAKAFAKSFYSSDMIDYITNKYDMDKDEFYDHYEDNVKSRHDFYGSYKDSSIEFELSFELIDKEKLDKDELDECVEELLSVCEINEYNAKVSTGYRLEGMLTSEVKGEKPVSYHEEYVVAKVDGDWILLG